jgi:tetratricopeptide (TPR) repeat protein
VTTTANGTSRFLEDAPSEIKDLLDWYCAGQTQGPPPHQMTEFAAQFLGAIREDGALIPTTPAVSAPHMLGLVLLHHLRNPENTGAWLNLGFALRRMALYRIGDPDHIRQRRLLGALEALERSRELEPENTGKNIRAWIGEAFTHHQLGLYEDEIRCCARVLEADRSDPRLWLFYGFALEAAGRKAEALSVMDQAYEAYLMAGEPDELKDVFVGVQTALPRH